MLIAFDQTWCVCSPKKTGTNSLVAMLAPMEYGRDGYDFAESVGGWHGYRWDGTGKRVLVVRHPIDRFTSMLWYAFVSGNPFGGPFSPERWTRDFLADREQGCSTYEEWWLTQSEIADVFRPDIVCRLEDGLERVFLAIGMPHRRMWRRNVNDQRENTEATLAALTDPTLAAIKAWAAEDLRRWYE